MLMTQPLSSTPRTSQSQLPAQNAILATRPQPRCVLKTARSTPSQGAQQTLGSASTTLMRTRTQQNVRQTRIGSARHRRGTWSIKTHRKPAAKLMSAHARMAWARAQKATLQKPRAPKVMEARSAFPATLGSTLKAPRAWRTSATMSSPHQASQTS